MTTLSRPRLLGHVLARRHIAASHRLVVLFDTQGGERHRVGERTWLVLSAMDGTRDAQGIVAFVSAQGVSVQQDEVEALVGDLASQGMVGEGIQALAPPEPAPTSPNRSAHPTSIWQLPGFALDCNGEGSCCRFYPSIAFTSLDVARARAAEPSVLDAGADPSRVFLPLYGSDARASSVTLVDGRCAFLSKDLGCSIHRSAGTDRKPLGCRTYPARFVDDGTHVRVSPWPECACVLRSGAAESAANGEPLLNPTVTTTATLDPAFHLEHLPDEVLVAPNKHASRAELAAWATAIYDTPTTDAVASLTSLARSLEMYGLDSAASREALERPTRPSADCFGRALAAVTPRLERLASEDWRGPNDLVRVTSTALHGACILAESLTEDLLEGPGVFFGAERFYVKNLLFGHHAVDQAAARPMTLLLFDRAFRALLGRALGVVASVSGLADPAFRQPLALVEATMRGYGVNGYLRDLAPQLGVTEQP